MKINRVIDYYNRSYYKAAKGKETARKTINSFKSAIDHEKRLNFYKSFKHIALNLLSGPFYWPTSWPTSLDPESGELVYSIVRLLKPKIAVEIGTFKGYAAICVGQALEDNNKGKLYTIDPVEMEIVKIAIRKSGLKNRIEYVVDYSENVISKLNLKEIDFAMIDGDHSYESVKKDFELIKDLISKGGTVVFHDTIWFEGPKKVVEEIKKTGEYEVITFPTRVGTDKNGKVCLSKKEEGFKSVGITVCYKL